MADIIGIFIVVDFIISPKVKRIRNEREKLSEFHFCGLESERCKANKTPISDCFTNTTAAG